MDDSASRRTVHGMTAYLVAALAAIVLTVPLTRLAAKRSATQPVSYDVASEVTILRAVLVDPVQWAWVSALTEDHFTHPTTRAAWRALNAELAHLPLPGGEVSLESGQAWIEELRLRSDIPAVADLEALVRTAFDGNDTSTIEADQATMPSSTDAPVTHDELVGAFETLSAAFEDRTRFNGASDIVAGTPGQALLVRRVMPVTAIRSGFVGFLMVSALTISVAVSQAAAASTAAQYLALAAMVVLSLASILWAVVDYDTMYLDTTTFWPSTAAAWLLALASGIVDHDLGRVLAGVLVAVIGAVIFEGSNALYRLVRGTDGMGGGDTLILLATAGVPAAITGSWVLGYQILLGSMIAALVGFAALRVVGRITRQSPFAFGPYLAVGWMLAMSWWLIAA